MAPSRAPAGCGAPAPQAVDDDVQRRQQPWLHDLVAVLAPPVQLWTGQDGTVRPGGAQGLWCGDVRVLSRLVATVGGRAPAPVSAVPDGASGQLVVSVARHLGDDGPDPTVRLEQRRRVCASGLEEEVVLVSSAHHPVSTQVAVHLAADLLSMDAVKAGRTAPPVASTPTPAGTGWERGGVRGVVSAPGASLDGEEGGLLLVWQVDLQPGQRWSATWSVDAADEAAVVAAAPPAGWPEQAVVTAGDRRLSRWVARSLEDLESLRMRTSGGAGGVFVAAGAPWYFTLFGRDSLWTARMLLPLGTDLASSTLRVLAARQGVRDDPSTGEEPGKVLHELRRVTSSAEQAGGTAFLPPAYYGTVDATALWVCLLHDAWRWGLPAGEVEPLLPSLEAALAWSERACAQGGGFVRYAGDGSGTGLTNQGWKDSGDAVQWSDGRLAEGPIALCEVQGYAYEAALGGAAVLDAFGRPGGDRWRSWAQGLAARFRERFWVEGDLGPHLAIALDATDAAVDAVTSNPGHLLGTGLLSAEESALVARRLVQPDLADGRGLRTMSSRMAGYSPLSYHGGSIWTHDTAIAVSGAARAGHPEVVRVLGEGLLDAAEAFGYRVPELHGGDARSAVPSPVPYPASCRPQAWSAASAVALLTAVVGLRPDVPSGRLGLSAVPGAPFGAVSAAGLRVAGLPVDVSVDAEGVARASGAGTGGLQVTV